MRRQGGSENHWRSCSRRSAFAIPQPDAAQPSIADGTHAGQEDTTVHRQDFPDDPARPFLTALVWVER